MGGLVCDALSAFYDVVVMYDTMSDDSIGKRDILCVAAYEGI